MTSNTPYTLSASDLSTSPDDVIKAVELLQAHGFIVTREEIKRTKFVVTLGRDEVENGDPDSFKRHLRRVISQGIGTQVMSHAQGKVEVVEGTGDRTFTAFADIIRPSRGFNPLASILGD